MSSLDDYDCFSADSSLLWNQASSAMEHDLAQHMWEEEIRNQRPRSPEQSYHAHTTLQEVPVTNPDDSLAMVPDPISDDEIVDLCKEIRLRKDLSLTKTQLDGLKFMINLEREKRGGILAHDVGMGKTLDMLMLERVTYHTEKGTTLVLCPLHISDVWMNECEKVFECPVSVLQYKGPKKKWISKRNGITTTGTSPIHKDFIEMHDIVIAHFESLTPTWAKKIQNPIRDFLWRNEASKREEKKNLEKKRKTQEQPWMRQRRKKEDNDPAEEKVVKEENVLDEEDLCSFGYSEHYEEAKALFSHLEWPSYIRSGCKLPEVTLTEASRDIVGDLMTFPFKRIVVDEVHIMRNPITHLAMMCNAMKSIYRWGVSGTPIVNYTNDVWSVFRFVQVEDLPALSEFKKYASKERELQRKQEEEQRYLSAREYAKKQKQRGRTMMVKSKNYLDAILLKYMHKVTKEELSNASMTPAQFLEVSSRYPGETMVVGVLGSVPPAYEREEKIHPSYALQEAYQAFTDFRKNEFLQIEDENRRSTHIFATIQYLRQLCSSPAGIARNVLESTCGKAATRALFQETPQKFEGITNYMKSCMKPDEKCLVFVHYKETCASVSKFLKDRGIENMTVTGDNKMEDKTDMCLRFQTNQQERVIIATHCLGLGVTLTRANHVIFVTPWWQPAEDTQCWGRTHRLGQTRDVHVVYLVMENTIEGRIRKVAESKKGGLSLSTNQLSELLGYTPTD